MHKRYPVLFSPVKLGSLELPNRVVLAPMATGYPDTDHQVTDRLIAYHVARAKGGVGLNIVEHTAVHRLGLTSPTMLGILDDSFIPGFRRLAAAVHEAGGRIALQIQHGGPQANPGVIGQECLSASAISSGRDRRIPREMTVKEIREVVKAFGDGARRAQQAGFDGVEVHMAHGYLGCSFLSPYLNRRTDAYGGDTVKRSRFAREVIEAIRKRCGRDFPVWCRVSGDEFIEGGQCLAEIEKTVPLLEEYGYCAIHVSACIGETSYYASAPHLLPEGHLLHLAEGVKLVASVPVMGVGNIRHAAFAESALVAGRCDIIALGRQLLADAEWCVKSDEGREADIVPCILCNLGCSDRRHSPDGLCECVTNPSTGHEVEWSDWPDGPPAAVKKKVLVVGGGPAGLTAAATAARRGHEVTLWERSAALGGRVGLMAWADRTHVYEELLDHMAGTLDASGAHVEWQHEADAGAIAQSGADVVIIATGSRPRRPEEALEEECSGEFVMAAEYLQNPEMPLSTLVAVLGGDEIGCLAASELARRGHEVMIFEREEQLGPGMVSALRHFTSEQLADAGVRVFTGCEVSKFNNGVVTGLVRGEQRREFPPASIVIALGRESVNDLAGPDAEINLPVHVIGDAKLPRTLHDAFWEGAEVGRKV